MPGYLNRVINADNGTKHVQRTIIKNNGKNFVCQVRVKPSSISLREMRDGNWYSVKLDDFLEWMTDRKNPKTTIRKS